MNKERKLDLKLKKINVSKLNNTIGGGDPLASNVLCANSVECSIPGVDCKTILTASDSVEKC
ncbi:hypothetical protein [Kordia sp.]|uniref:hypothetical protein n=1 Tax=Kordia sp. TaxID=1965332 RepID=UPI0025BC6DDB|nr:hypothetical protein [Kordia sp.]MCH2195786.1 hypothetical protein [Kordia sp.]